MFWPLRIKITGTLTALLAASLAASLARAQEVLPAPATTLADPQTSGKRDAGRDDSAKEANLLRLSEAMKKLRKERRELAAEYLSAEKGVTHQSSSRQRTAGDVMEMKRQADAVRQSLDVRSKRLSEKLSRLRLMIEERGACTPEQPSDDDRPPRPPQVTLDAPDDAMPTEKSRELPTAIPPAKSMETQAITAPVASGSHATPPNSTPEVKSDRHQGPFPRGSSSHASDHTVPPPVEPEPDTEHVPAIPVLDGPVDRLALANNLYGTSELKLALEIYEKIDRSELTPAEQLWVQYQIANCHRRLGNRADAERAFRIVTSRDKNSWVSQNARWWLDINDKAGRLEQRAVELKKSLDEFQRMKDSHDNRPLAEIRQPLTPAAV